MDAEYILKLLPILLEGMLVSLKIFTLTLFFSIPFGFIVCIGKMSKYKFINIPVNLYILIMRGTPLILQIIFIYFAPFYLFGATWDRFTAVIVAFTVNYAAYFSEIFRGGIKAIPQGQYEAASVLGLTKVQTFFRIILPQVVKHIMPASANEVITLVKDTALAQVIGITELFALAQKQAGFKSSVLPLFVAGIFYFVLNGIVTIAFNKAEQKLNYYR